MSTVPPHWIRHNATTRQPRRWIWLDTEAGSTPTATGWIQEWTVAVTAFDDTDKRNRTERPTEWATHTTPAELWAWVDARTKKGHRTVLVAHNLAYDLRIAKAMEHLPALGWALDGIRLDGGQAWAVWRRDGRTLSMADSMSWIPAGLDKVGRMIGHGKVPLPAPTADIDAWVHRCQVDVEILRTAMLRIWAWLEAADLGVWQLTGAGMAWSAWRHKHMTHKILVHTDVEARAAEREAAWTGRCEAWRWGEIHGAPFTEWDLEMAYATVAAECEVPVRYRGHAGRVRWSQVARWMRDFAVLARVTVTTDQPLVPASVDGRIAWPVGTFDTVLWDPELGMLEAAGAEITVQEAWVYDRAPALAQWAEWCMELARGGGDGADPLVAMVAKHWTRSLIGRFGLRYGRWEQAGTSPVCDVQLIPGFDLDREVEYRILQVGHALYTETEAADGDNAVPSIMAWVMSECRRRLWEIMATAGLSEVAYVDTDSILTSPKGSARLREARRDGRLVNLRPKGSWDRMTVHGPRSLVLDGKLRAAGVPSDAEQVADDRWEAVVWRGLATSLTRGEPGAVSLDRRTVQIRGTDHRREHLADGTTAPVRLPAETATSSRSPAAPLSPLGSPTPSP